MQIYALDENQLISAYEAQKRKNYQCPECLNSVRFRSGRQKQPHFFHLSKHLFCHQSKKGMIHLRLQYFIKNLLKGAEMEKSFPEINRIADVACMETKKIYEIQYSPLSLEEAKMRCADYERIGFEVIWILHEHTYNQKKLRPPERFLRTKTCYFSNMDAYGKGMIYDQMDIIQGFRRLFKSPLTPVNLEVSHPIPQSSNWPPFLEHRIKTWPFYHEGDVIDQTIKKTFFSKPLVKKKFLIRIKEAYLALLHMLLLKI